jgi:YbbR domain-containing protein
MKNSLFILWNNIRSEKGLLALCFLLAFIAWQGIHKNIGFEVSVSNVAVDVDVPEGWAVWEKSVHRVNILFRGSREDIRYLNNEQLRVVIPMLDPERGEEIHIKLSDKYLRNPTGAKVAQFSPSEITIKLDQESERLLPVKAALNGSLPEGLNIDRIICTPLSVRVSGAREVLDEMESIHTDPIELKDRQVSFKESVPVALPQAGRMRIDPDWISVEVILVEHSSERVFEGVPLKVLCSSGERRQISIQPQIINITVKGQQQHIEQIQQSDIFAYVSCTDLVENTGYDVPVVVYLPDGIKLVRTEPAVVNVRINNSN